jgi:hypothetical protein
MSTVRIALANIRVPVTRDESVRLATSAVADASRRGAPDGTIAGWQDQGQIDPSEEMNYPHSGPTAGSSPPVH